MDRAIRRAGRIRPPRVLVTGMGEKAAREGVERVEPPPAVVVISGCAGALDESLGPGDVVVASEIVDREGRALSSATGLIDAYLAASASAGVTARTGRLLTSGAVLEPGEKQRLGKQTGALAVDMETAAIAAWAEASGVPFVAIRAILDSVARPVADFGAAIGPAGEIRPVALLALFCRKPRLVGEVPRLAAARQRCERALIAVHTRWLAKALGCGRRPPPVQH
ncbi:MAG: adenosylhomocysteine nucleosidase [Candidatus Binatota bacterium]|nr:adenosylhomocysteine nucleosidase [Candidatus Binatota bacterium]